MSVQHVNNYEVIAKIHIERDGDVHGYVLNLLYRGDGTHWLATNAGLEWSVSRDFFDEVSVGQRLSITTAAHNIARKALGETSGERGTD